MDTNVIIAIVAVVVIAAILVIGGWWLGKTRKNAVDKSTEDAKAKADARLAAEAKSAAADSSTVKPSVDSNVDAAEKLRLKVSRSPRLKLPLPKRQLLHQPPKPSPNRFMKPPNPPARACSVLRCACRNPAIRSARLCSTFLRRISFPKPTGKTSKTPSCLPTWARKPANSSSRNYATTLESQASPIRPKCVPR